MILCYKFNLLFIQVILHYQKENQFFSFNSMKNKPKDKKYRNYKKKIKSKAQKEYEKKLYGQKMEGGAPRDFYAID